MFPPIQIQCMFYNAKFVHYVHFRRVRHIGIFFCMLKNEILLQKERPIDSFGNLNSVEISGRVSFTPIGVGRGICDFSLILLA